VTAMSTIASADPSCPVRLVPRDAGESWQAARRRAAERVEGLPPSERDCRDVVIALHGDGDGALVTLTTDDGRRAERPVHEAREVDAVVSALLVTVPALAATPTEPASPPEPVAPPAPAPDRAQPRAISLSNHLVMGLGGGGRMGLSGSLASPTVGGSIAGLFGRFEVGVFGARETGYGVASDSLPAGFQLTATSVGAFTGLRWPVGSTALLGGITVGAAFVQERVTTPPTIQQGMGQGQSQNVLMPGGTASVAPTEARLGAYTGVVFPARTRFGVRTQLGFGVVPFRVNDNRSTAGENLLPPLSSWAAGLTIGLEGAIL
jgi:hypothetical protein